MNAELLLILKEKVQMIKEQEIYFFGENYSNLRNLISKAIDELNHMQRGELINISYGEIEQGKNSKNIHKIVIDYVISQW